MVRLADRPPPFHNRLNQVPSVHLSCYPTPANLAYYNRHGRNMQAAIVGEPRDCAYQRHLSLLQARAHCNRYGQDRQATSAPGVAQQKPWEREGCRLALHLRYTLALAPNRWASPRLALRSRSSGSARGVPQCCCTNSLGRGIARPPPPSIPPPPVAVAWHYQFSHVLGEGGGKLSVGDTPTSPFRPALNPTKGGWPPPEPPLCSYLCNTTGGAPSLFTPPIIGACAQSLPKPAPVTAVPYTSGGQSGYLQYILRAAATIVRLDRASLFDCGNQLRRPRIADAQAFFCTNTGASRESGPEGLCDFGARIGSRTTSARSLDTLSGQVYNLFVCGGGCI